MALAVPLSYPRLPFREKNFCATSNGALLVFTPAKCTFVLKTRSFEQVADGFRQIVNHRLGFFHRRFIHLNLNLAGIHLLLNLLLNGFRDFFPHAIRFAQSNGIRIITKLTDVAIVLWVSFKRTFDFHNVPQSSGASAIYIHPSVLSFSCFPHWGSAFFIIFLTMREMVVSSCLAIAASASFSAAGRRIPKLAIVTTSDYFSMWMSMPRPFSRMSKRTNQRMSCDIEISFFAASIANCSFS